MSKEDFLDVDQPIPGQNFVCLSFVSPETNILQKHTFNFYKFTSKLLDDKNMLENLQAKNNLSNFNDLYENFLEANKQSLTSEYNNMNDFQTSVRGVKVRGTYESEREAKVRAEVLRRRCPNDNVFIGQVGYWLPWDPNPLDVKNLEYQETELNTLMKKYNENMEHREYMFDEEKRTQVEKARKENEKIKNDNEKIENNSDHEENQKKFSEFREILNEKDNLMNSNDPWLQRKEEENKVQENTIEEIEPEPEPDPEPDPKPDSEPDPEPDPKPDPKPDPEPDPKPDQEPESVLKDEDVEQEIVINYANSDDNQESLDDNNQESLDDNNQESLVRTISKPVAEEAS